MFGLYIHWPFCLSKCPYCDFNSHRIREIDQARWRLGFQKELGYLAQNLPLPALSQPLSSLFFGGGTPSLMEPKTVEVIIETAQSLWGFTDSIEITLEANPTSAEMQKFQGFKTAGVNRLSLGIQSLRDEGLQSLGREHSVKEAISAYEMAQRIFPRISADFIYGRAGQTIEMWNQELDDILKLVNDHVSLYHLTLEENTPFARNPPPDLPEDDDMADMFTLTRQRLAMAGLPAYEVSNYAALGHESQHNLIYWRGYDYLASGPGAHGRSGLMASEKIRSPHKWLEQVENLGHGTAEIQTLEPYERAIEVAMMGLRLSQGINKQEFLTLTRYDLERVICPQGLKELMEDGLILADNQHLRLTDRGWLLLNSITLRLLNFTTD